MPLASRLLLLLLASSAAGYHPQSNANVLLGRGGGASRRSGFPPSTPSFPIRMMPATPLSHPPRVREEHDGSHSDGPSRRDVLNLAAAALVGTTSALVPPSSASAASDVSVAAAAVAGGYRYSPDWTGTSLSLLPPREAAALSRRGRANAADGDGGFAFPMGRWPDPLLRRPASPVPPSLLGSSELRDVALALRSTARAEGAVGLAAQQCGVDVRMVWLDDYHAAAGDARRNGVVRWLAERWKHRADGDGGGGGGDEDDATLATLGEGVRGHHYYHDDGEGLFLVNPRIVARSPEADMKVWTERCLVLPPSFSASVLRDATIVVEYETLDGVTEQAELRGELARACQHEMDHDRGILITDHVGLEELESDDMRRVETGGHGERMAVAYARTVEESRLSSSSSSGAKEGASRALSSRQDREGSEEAFWESFLVPHARAENTAPVLDSSASACDEKCLENRRRIIEERRAMMRQSRSSTSRQDVFDLSRQRAALYNATYKGASCPPGVPCL